MLGLGGREGLLDNPNLEGRENPLPFFLGGGVGGVSRLRFPPGPHLRSSSFSRHPRLRQAPTRRFAKNRNLRGLGGFCGEKAPGPWRAGPQALGARAPSPLETWPTGPWGLDPATLTAELPATRVFNFLLRRVSKP